MYKFKNKAAESIYLGLPKQLDAGLNELYELQQPQKAVPDANYEMAKAWSGFTTWNQSLQRGQGLADHALAPVQAAVKVVESALTQYYAKLQQNNWTYRPALSGDLEGVNTAVKALSVQCRAAADGTSMTIAAKLQQLENVAWRYARGAAGIIEGAEKPDTDVAKLLAEIRTSDERWLPDPLRGDPLRGGPVAGGQRLPPLPDPSKVPPPDPVRAGPGGAEPDPSKPSEPKPSEPGEPKIERPFK